MKKQPPSLGATARAPVTLARRVQPYRPKYHTPPASGSPLQSLPDDVLRRLLAGVPFLDHGATAVACRAFRAVINGPQFLALRRRYGFAEHDLVIVGGNYSGYGEDLKIRTARASGVRLSINDGEHKRWRLSFTTFIWWRAVQRFDDRRRHPAVCLPRDQEHCLPKSDESLVGGYVLPDLLLFNNHSDEAQSTLLRVARRLPVLRRRLSPSFECHRLPSFLPSLQRSNWVVGGFASDAATLHAGGVGRYW